MDERPKYERLKQTIKNNIRDGIWKPGDKLPSENILCDHFGVSKITVKKAKDELVTEGVIEFLPGRKGVFVRKLHRIPLTGFIGVVIDDINEPPFAEMLKGIEDKLWEDKLHLILGNMYSDSKKMEAYFQSLLQSNNVAGVIFAPVRGIDYRESNQRLITLFTERHVPYILLDRYIPNYLFSSVVSDNYQASKELTTRLLRKGHTRILALAGIECSSMDERVQGYLDAIKEAGITQDSRLLLRINEDWLLRDVNQQQAELDRVKTLAEQTGDFTACYLMNTGIQRALRAICSISKAKSDLEVVTYDDVSEFLLGIVNRVTLVKQPGYKMGWEAAKLLIEAIHEPEQRVVQITLKSEIVEKVLE